jgi:hypothetical protein
MKSNRFVSVLVLAIVARCAAPQAVARDEDALWPDTEFHFVEGGGVTYAEDNCVVLAVKASDGRLYCNGVDTGPYRAGTPVRFVSLSTCVVDGERRPIPPARRTEP